jgi:hypothetical protein
VIGRRDPEAPPADPAAYGDAPAPAGNTPGGPRHRTPIAGGGQRIGLVVGAIILVLALGAGGVFFYVRHQNPPTPSSAQATADVRQAYLAWWGAREKAYLELNAAPMKALMTDQGFTEEKGRLGQQASTGDPLRMVADHNPQIVVYRDGGTASIDDVWVDHSVSLDPTTRQPLQQDPDLAIEDSTVLRKQGGHWLVDTIRRFGVARAIAGQTVSYAAVGGGQAVPQPMLGDIEEAFQKFNMSSASAFRTLQPSQLQQVENGGALTHDTALIQQQVASNEYVRVDEQHNYRIGVEQAGVVWVYDTIADYSVSVNRATNQAVTTQGRQTFINRTAFEFSQGSGSWKVDYILGEN